MLRMDEESGESSSSDRVESPKEMSGPTGGIEDEDEECREDEGEPEFEVDELSKGNMWPVEEPPGVVLSM